MMKPLANDGLHLACLFSQTYLAAVKGVAGRHHLRLSFQDNAALVSSQAVEIGAVL